MPGGGRGRGDYQVTFVSLNPRRQPFDLVNTWTVPGGEADRIDRASHPAWPVSLKGR